MPVTTIEWLDKQVRIIDQTKLPHELVYLSLSEVDAVAEAIRSLRIRGAPAIGIAAAFGMALVAQNSKSATREAFFAHLESAAETLRKTRPTAVNLSWALNRMRQVVAEHCDQDIATIKKRLMEEAQSIYHEDQKICREIGAHGAALIPQAANVITHCNTGALATADFGTALGVLFAAHDQGKKLHVYVDETRPLLQGARLNMWELMQEGIPCTLICDSAAGFVMQRRKIDCCLVGADRIARNGDTANKIGTYSLAVNAKHHRLPFYVVAPVSSIDFKITGGVQIPIEERSPEEVRTALGHRLAPENSPAFNPAFDVTPHELITAIVTEAGIIYPPFEQALAALEK
jgi:methylthioribose-1-phosphate isomerase